MIDVSEKDLLTITSILETYVPDCEVRAFGSRVSWTAKDHSDLDLVVVGSNKLESRKIDRLKGALEESSLPFRVDVLDWHRISPEFQRNIEKNFKIIKKSGQKTSNGWRYVKVADFAEVVGGGTPKTGVQEYWSGDIPWITPKDLSDHKERYISHGERNITKEGLKNSSARIVPENTVLLTSRAPVGYLAIAKNSLTTNQGFRSLIVKEGFSPEFIYYLLLNNVDYLKQHASGSTFQELSGSTLKNLQFQIPALSEQLAIAKILSDLDEKIELNQQMNKIIESIAQALFKQWFLDFEFSDGSGKSYKSSGGKMVESELGEIPEGWAVKEIADCGEIVCGKTPPTVDKDNYGNDRFFITIPDMRDQAFVIKTERKLSKQGASMQKNKELPPLSVCVSCIATPGLVSLTSDISQTNQQINSIICKKDISPYCMYYAMINKSEEIKTMGLGGTATLNLNTGNFACIKVIIPNHAIMEAFHKMVTPLMERVLMNSRENISLCDIRDSLLSKLMLGRIRVEVN